ncbi:MAG: glycosyltransferase family 4 protein [Acidobacteriota bacterium]|nr:glycosyltransferase family 4 protein [Blastocatellia bacterium]MDW8238364.1 glycosyltransferase family 4 protein [Acidobacteriota bacterium]
MRLAILCPDFPPERSALADHTAALAAHLGQQAEVAVITSQRNSGAHSMVGVRVEPCVRSWNLFGIIRVQQVLCEFQPDWLIVQYVPHMYGRAGINLALPLMLWWWRLHGYRIFLLLHELYLAWSLRPKRMIAGLLQRLMLMMCVAAACRVGVSTQVWQQKLQRLFPMWLSHFHYLPSPSNIPVTIVSDAEKRATRAQLGLAGDSFVVGLFGTLHDSVLLSYVRESLSALQACGQRTQVLYVGPASGELAGSLGSSEHGMNWQVICTGYVEPAWVSRYLSLMDVLLLPLVDGVSSRRSSLMAALSHRLAVVTTSGPGTDPLLTNSAALTLSPVNDQQAFVANVCMLATDQARRRQLAEAGERLYRDHFSWPVVTQRLLSIMENAHERA